MQSIENASSQIKELIQHARQVLVASHATDPDGVAASLALTESIKSFGRQAILVNPQELSGDQASLPGAQEIRKSVGPRSFVISINYVPDSIEKVSYNTEGDKFNMVITPRNGAKLGADQVDYSYSGQDYDLVITVGVPDLALLGKVYEAESSNWTNMPLINIDRHPTNAQFGKINALDPEAATVSEVVTRVIVSTKLPLNKSIGELLLYGLRAGTNDFMDASPATFDLAAQITRSISGHINIESSEERLVNEPFRKEQFQSGEGNVAN